MNKLSINEKEIISRIDMNYLKMMPRLILFLFINLLYVNNAQSSLEVERSQQNVYRMQHDLGAQTNGAQCDITSDNARFDCYPGPDANPSACQAKGCCWKEAEITQRTKGSNIDVPYCYFPRNYNGYKLSNISKTASGFEGRLSRRSKSGWPDDVMELSFSLYFTDSNSLRFKIGDTNSKRYEVPIAVPPLPSKMPSSMDYAVTLNEDPFSIVIKRKSTGAVLFDSSVAPLIFADQFIQISTQLSTGQLYGLGEHKDRLLHTADSWTQRSFWARDQGPAFNANLYGVHPFYLAFEPDGQTHGVFLLNSNAMEVLMQPLPALTFRTIGGILDLFVFLGPEPDTVVQQYAGVIGKPAMPPYWALGFHLCRYGYGSSDQLKKVIARNRAIGIPYEAQWNDIDYMDDYLDWTYSPDRYEGLPDIVKDLHDHGQKYVIIIDPGISYTQPAGKYPPYDEGDKMGIFVKNSTGQWLYGKVWPGPVVFPDFSNPAATEWWYNQAKRYHDDVPFDGLWTDMNEPSNFVGGSAYGCTKSKYDNPPYTPGITDGSLSSHTVCPSALHQNYTHYDLHSLYGHFEVIASSRALEKLRGKRSLVISRSSFPGTGVFGGHWSGDISSTWEDLRYSIPVMLEFQMFGLPLVGADTCGFHGKATEEMCVRWMQLAAFYPFMRNHNDLNMPDQDPAVFSPKAQDLMKDALLLRYSLLPFLYSLFYATHLSGRPHVVRPLSFSFPRDMQARAIDEQFMWGTSLLISPALYEGQKEVKAYFPEGLWYPLTNDMYNIPVVTGPQWRNLSAPLDPVTASPVHLRGGSIIFMQTPNVTTTLSRKNPFSVVAALNEKGEALGNTPLNWDDGEMIDAHEQKKLSSVVFDATKNQLQGIPIPSFKPEGGMPLEFVAVFGVKEAPTKANVTIGQGGTSQARFDYSRSSQLLKVYTPGVDLLTRFWVRWQ